MSLQANPELHRYLTELGMTIAVAESLTGGNLGALITASSGSSTYFLGGILAYTLDAKVGFCGVDSTHAAEVNCVSSRVAEEMAVGVMSRFGSDIGLATTGYAERSLVTGSQHAYIGIATADGRVESKLFKLHHPEVLPRTEMQDLVAQEAIAYLLSLDLTCD